MPTPLIIALGIAGLVLAASFFGVALGRAAAMGDEDMARAAREEFGRDEW
jgi:hypothetical protein